MLYAFETNQLDKLQVRLKRDNYRFIWTLKLSFRIQIKTVFIYKNVCDFPVISPLANRAFRWTIFKCLNELKKCSLSPIVKVFIQGYLSYNLVLTLWLTAKPRASVHQKLSITRIVWYPSYNKFSCLTKMRLKLRVSSNVSSHCDDLVQDYLLIIRLNILFSLVFRLVWRFSMVLIGK